MRVYVLKYFSFSDTIVFGQAAHMQRRVMNLRIINVECDLLKNKKNHYKYVNRATLFKR